MGKAVVESQDLHTTFDCTVIPIQSASNLSSLGSLSLSKIFGSLGIFSATYRALRAQADAMYITASISGFAAIRDLCLVLLCRAFKARPIIHLHMKGMGPRYQRSVFYRLLYRLMFTDAEVIHLSDALYADVAPVVPRSRFHIVPNGIPDPLAGADSDTAAGPRVALGPPTVLFMSNLLREKGPLDLLAASERLLAEGVAHRVVFAGSDAWPEVADALRKAATRNPETFELTGGVFGAQKEALFLSADIFAFPTFYDLECQPLVLIEAMAASLPLISTPEGAIPDLVGEDAGILCAQRDVGALAAAMRRLITNPRLREQMGRAARSRYAEKFTLERFEKRFVATLAALMDVDRLSHSQNQAMEAEDAVAPSD